MIVWFSCSAFDFSRYVLTLAYARMAMIYGLDLAREIVDRSGGRLYSVKDVSDVGAVIIGDYDSLV